PPGCTVTGLDETDQDTEAALELLADQVAAGTKPVLVEAAPPPPADPGPLNAISLANTIAASLPEHSIISDEANTSGFALPMALAAAPRHTLLTLTGGSGGPGHDAAARGRLDRPGHPRRDRRGHRRPGPAGPVAGGRRQRALHDPGAVDPGAGAARRHPGADQQRRLRDPADGTGPHPGWRDGGRGSRGAGRPNAGPVPPHPGLPPAQYGPRRSRPPRHHDRGTGPGAARGLRRTRP